MIRKKQCTEVKHASLKSHHDDTFLTQCSLLKDANTWGQTAVDRKREGERKL